MKRSSYTVIRSADGSEKGINEVVLLPKGRLLGIMNAPTKNFSEDHLIDVDDSSLGLDTRKERVVVKKGDGILEGTATKVGICPSSLGSDMTGLSIESLAKAVEAMVDKESQGLNIQAAEALAKAANLEGHGGKGLGGGGAYPLRVYKKVPVSPPSSSSSGSSSSSTSSSSSPERLSKSNLKVKKLSKVSKISKKSKKKTNHIPSVIPHAVDVPSADHNYAFTNNLNHGAPLHFDSEGQPMDSPPSIDEWGEADGMDIDPLVSSMNDQLNKLIADIDAPAPMARVSNENEEPVIGEGANVTVEHEELMVSKPKKSRSRSKNKVVAQSEEVKVCMKLYVLMICSCCCIYK